MPNGDTQPQNSLYWPQTTYPVTYTYSAPTDAERFRFALELIAQGKADNPQTVANAALRWVVEANDA